MTKLIYSDSFDPLVGTGMTIVTDTRELKKSASTVFGCDYGDVKPPKGQVGVHMIALGDEEAYGPNRNADGFPEHANETYHHTFSKFGAVYEHHRNRDPEKKLGEVVKTAHNRPMSRVELFMHVDEKKAADHLGRIEKEGSVPGSMSCVVPNDRCSVCHTLRKNAKDPDQCDHVRYSLGKMAENGKLIYTHNDEPKFIDISFVGRPADRTAYGFKVASGFESSIDAAEAEGVVTPECLAYQSEDAQAKRALYVKLANFEKYFQKLENGRHTGQDMHFWELRKAATATLSDPTLDELRSHTIETVAPALARRGVVLSFVDFYKYAFGRDYGELSSHVKRASTLVRSGLFGFLESAGRAADVCNDGYFERGFKVCDLPASLLAKVAHVLSFTSPSVADRAIEATLGGRDPHMVFIKYAMDNATGDKVVGYLLEKYAAYKLSALRTALAAKGATEETVLALAAAQDLF